MNEITTLPGQTKQEVIEEHDVETNIMGMWVFLASEVLFFGAVFTAFFLYRETYPDAFREASQHLKVALGTINTFVLLTSSLSMALAVMSAQLKRKGGIVFFLSLTILLGLVFLGIKGYEYYLEFSEHLFPGSGFAYAGPNAPQVKLFFSLYFIMTGLHAIHMIIGILLMLTLIIMAFRGSFNRGNFVPVEMVGLFWHFVDIVWIFIFPLLYLYHML